jgi:heme a synthase
MNNQSRWLHRYAIFVSVSTAVLLYWGGLVTSTGSGLAVPDWPLSYGMLMPPMVGGIFYEHGHRMVATFVGLLTIILAFWVQKKEERKWLRTLGWLALGTVIFQGLLGGITVLFFLPVPVSVFHATLAQTFFCITVAIALFTSSYWKRSVRHSLDPHTASLRTISAILLTAVYLQLILGAVMRHMEAGLAIPDFPLAFGRVLPPIDSADILIHFLHRLGAIGVSVAVIWFAVHVFKYYRSYKEFVLPAVLLTTLVIIQITLGAFVIWSEKGVVLATFHVITGALILGTAAVSVLLSFHLIRPAQQILPLQITPQNIQ